MYHPPIAEARFTRRGVHYLRIHYPGKTAYYKLVTTYKGQHWRWLGTIEAAQ